MLFLVQYFLYSWLFPVTLRLEFRGLFLNKFFLRFSLSLFWGFFLTSHRHCFFGYACYSMGSSAVIMMGRLTVNFSPPIVSYPFITPNNFFHFNVLFFLLTQIIF